jgi:hypothetical protein
MRETVLLNRAMAGDRDGGPEIVPQLRQRDFDDVRHDAMFPNHPLSVVRTELRDVLDSGSIVVLAPPLASSPGEVVLGELGCAVVPPPRYLLTARAPTDRFAQFCRLSFAGTDGVQLLTLLARHDKRLRPAGTEGDLLDAATHLAGEVPNGAQNLQIDVHSLPDADGRTHVMAYRTYDDTSGIGPQHSAFRFFVPAAGRLLIIAIGTGRCVPKHEILAELDSVVASWRPLDGKPSTHRDRRHQEKPWWRIW